MNKQTLVSQILNKHSKIYDRDSKNAMRTAIEDALTKYEMKVVKNMLKAGVSKIIISSIMEIDISQIQTLQEENY